MYIKVWSLLIFIAACLQIVKCRTNGSDICRLPEDRGRCRALINRWRYNMRTGQCNQFKFGGCGGNENNFASKESCLDACAGTLDIDIRDMLL
ncbi:unnamed protein product [Phyllotreta striolata]|uniref:BPTI/Kunitz inhibitor domain-containing protein n=1 Tax=Phyllotreta striolata TaxID=444603 RepID=A0A9N9XQG4_PHYSR|nr:unnamed protein product [Phyllotreta striolata]